MLLTVISAPVNFSFVAWVAIVPFLLASAQAVKKWQLVLGAWLVGFIYWAGNLYWLWYVTGAGQIALCMYLGIYWAGLAVCVRYCRAKGYPLFIVAPILWAGAETLQGWFCDGVAWRFLAHSQYSNLTLIQIADVVGTAGVTFVIAMVNGLAADWIIASKEKRLRQWQNLIKGAITVILLSITTYYGHVSLKSWAVSIAEGPIIAALQPNVPLEVKESEDKSDEIFADCLRDSDAARDARAKLIAWPETMVQAVLNPEVLRLVEPNSQQRKFDAALREHTKGKCYALVGAYGRTIKWTGGQPDYDQKYNSAFLYRADGTPDSKSYNKIHLVPFGEVVPFKQSIPWLHSLLMNFTPYDYDYTLDYGTEYTVFEMADGGHYRFGVLICYEDTVPYIARNLAIAKQLKTQNSKLKTVDWLVNISNDGWFVRFADLKVFPSTELRQHAAICVFRAVENRLPILRSVNTGISCLIDSNGKIRDGYLAGNLPKKAMDRQGMAGWFADIVLIDKRITFFSLYGQWLGFGCAALFVALLLIQLFSTQKPKLKTQN
jgi:apolipoprotein N-acyltransferase